MVMYRSQVVVPCAENQEGHADRNQTLNQEATARPRAAHRRGANFANREAPPDPQRAHRRGQYRRRQPRYATCADMAQKWVS